MLWREAAKLFGYQLLAAIIVLILDLAFERLAGRELPSVMGAIGSLVAAQAFAMRRYQRYRDDLAGRIFALSWRSTLFMILLASLILLALGYSLPEEADPLALAKAVGLPVAGWVALAVVGIGGNIGVTAGGLKMGARLAKKAAAKSPPGPA